MEANDREELIEKIIKEQDLVCIYICNDTNKSLDWNAKYYNNLGYGEIIDVILENPEIIDSFSMKNLYTLLASKNNKEILEKINKRISEKLENEDFFCEDIEMAQFFLSSTEHTYANYYRIDEDLRKMIGKKIEDELKNFRGTEYDRIDKALREYPDAANFLKYCKDGIFTPEKIETINQMIEKSPDALRYVNFGIFQDEIFEMGPEFCEYISKFPTLSAQLMVIKEHAPQVLKAISSRVKTYEDLKENLEELEVLITYSAKNAFELQGQEINIDEFIECAYRDSNDLKLINVKYGKNYNERLEEKFNDEYEKAKNLYFKGWIIERKLDVYMNKVYSLSVDRAKVLIKDYASDLENLKNISEGTRQFFEKLNEVIKLNDEDEIDRLFNTENVKYTPTKIQEMKKEISRECAKEFATEFEKTNQEIQQKLQEENNEDV